MGRHGTPVRLLPMRARNAPADPRTKPRQGGDSAAPRGHGSWFKDESKDESDKQLVQSHSRVYALLYYVRWLVEEDVSLLKCVSLLMCGAQQLLNALGIESASIAERFKCS